MTTNKEIRKIVLVHAPLNLSSAPIPNTGSLAPLGLLSLATYLQNKDARVDIKIIDGDFLGLKEAERAIGQENGEIVGIGVQACESYPSALKLAKTAKETGAKVILGGEQATLRAMQILTNRKEVDYVIKAQGEVPLEMIVKGSKLKDIPNLVFRNQGQVIENTSFRIPINKLPIPKRDFILQNEYAERFKKTLESELTGFQSFATAKTQDGCLKAIKRGVCTFCQRSDLFLAGLRKPEIFWKEMNSLANIGVDYVWDVSASFSTPGYKYLKKIADAKPSNLNISLRVYARADDLSKEEVVEQLDKIGVENVLVGFDSGNQACLNSSNKGDRIEQHYQAAKNLKKYGIATYSAFVLGHLAETYQSMIDTLNHARNLKDILGEELFRITTCSKLQPYPDTEEYRFLLERVPLLKRLENEDMINIQELSDIYFKEVLNLDPMAANDISEKIRALSPIKSGKDMSRIDYIH